MKYTFCKDDLIFGSYICRQSWSEDSEDISGLCSVTYMLGWKVSSRQCCTLISIADGMVLEFSGDDKDARETILKAINSDKYGYRPLTRKQVKRRLNYLFRNEGKAK